MYVCMYVCMYVSMKDLFQLESVHEVMSLLGLLGASGLGFEVRGLGFEI